MWSCAGQRLARSVRPATAQGTAHGAHARCARPPPSNRAHRAPPYTGVRGGVRGRRGQPRAPGAPVAARPGEGWSADSSESQQRRRTAPSLRACRPAVTLSNENAPSRFRACSDPHPPTCGRQRAAHGPERALMALVVPFRPSEEEDLRQLWRTLCRPNDSVPAGHAPRGGQSAANTAADWPPSGEWSGRAEMVRFARLIHRPVRAFGQPSAGAACGGNLILAWLLPTVVR
jgi:hypothetical protein